MGDDHPLNRRRLLKAGSIAITGGLAGCSGETGGSNPSSQTTELSPESGVDLGLPETAGCPDGAASRLRSGTDLARVMEATYPDVYTGPLFLAHEHFYVPLQNARGDWEMRGECLSAYLEFMDRNDVSTVLPFVGAQQLAELQEYPDRFTPFLNDFVFTSVIGDTPIGEWSGMVEQLLAAHDGIAGLGEFALFNFDKESEKAVQGRMPSDPLPADHPALSDVYEIAAAHGLPVMLHPFLDPPQLGEVYRDRPLASPEVRALANAFETHPDTTFLVHGLQPVGDWISTLLAEHPNWYYDVSGLMTPHSFNQQSPGEPPVAFDEHMTPSHIRVHAERAFTKWESILRNAPERVVMGFDMGSPWTLDATVLDSWVQVFRSVLGYLPQETARNIAHRNAERMVAGN